MKRLTRIYGLIVLTALVACGTDDASLAGADLQNSVSVIGDVTAIQNEIASDGGITLDITVAKAESKRLIFGGLFTEPPPTEEHLRLYDVVGRVEVGDTVRGWGVRRDYGIILEKLWILDGQP